MTDFRLPLSSAALLVALLSAPRPAAAGLDACGDIHVQAEATCELVPPGVECEGMCTPLSVEAACAAELGVECVGSCDELPGAECTGQCTADCEAECDELEPGEIDCRGACEADCGGRCEAHCEAAEDSAECVAQCRGNCSASCEGSCDVELPEADCEASCEASCEGSCQVDTNFDCQMECQSMGFSDCEAEIQGGCQLECEGDDGALFCEGQYVDHGDNLDECIDSLRAVIAAHVMVEGEAYSESGCTDGEGCMVEARARAKVSSDCSVRRPGPSGAAGGAAMLLPLLGSLLWRRRRR
ncbi:MAG: hypothetical protein PVI30_04340 [Myxococcales bacterium]|jgi:hypothetical protein